MAEADDFSRYSRRGGYAWLSPSYTYPHRWNVSIPTGRDSWRTQEVSSLEDAFRVVDEHGLQLDVDDWTYARMVDEGVAPAARPDAAHRPPGVYPGTGPGDEDVRPLSWAVLQQAPDFIGLTAAAATHLATERNLDVRMIDEDDHVMTADYGPWRLNLYIARDRVTGASVG